MNEIIETIIERIDLIDDWADSEEPLKLMVADLPPTENPWYHQSERFNYSGKRGVRY